MKKFVLYHNSRCSKSRAAFDILQSKGIDFEVVEYLNTPPTAVVLDQLLQQLKVEPQQIVRTGEDEYEALGLEKNPPKSREAWIQILIQHPILIERPIVTDGFSAVVGRPPEKISEWLSK